jgi:hypothetical protein
MKQLKKLLDDGLFVVLHKTDEGYTAFISKTLNRTTPTISTSAASPEAALAAIEDSSEYDVSSILEIQLPKGMMPIDIDDPVIQEKLSHD